MLPTIAALRTHANAIAAQVVARERRQVGVGLAADRERVDALARAIVNRLLHEPTRRMKEMRDDRVHARMALVRDLFGLSVGDDALAAAAPEPAYAGAGAAGAELPGAELGRAGPAANVHPLPARGAARPA